MMIKKFIFIIICGFWLILGEISFMLFDDLGIDILLLGV